MGIVTINLPILKPLFSAKFWSLQSFKGTSLSHGNTHNLDHSRSPYELSTSINSKSHNKSRSRSDEEDCQPVISSEDKSIATSMSEESFARLDNPRSGSEEFIFQGAKDSSGVTVSTTLHVESEGVEKGHGIGAWQKRGMGVSSTVSVHPRGK